MKVIMGMLTIIIALLAPLQVQEEGLVAEWHFDEGSGFKI